ncbi:MAG: 2-oxoglutarate synthase [Gemmatimonadetes bacterium]|jgi:2-oxoglutarate/2-oxoacid ferredoxin oxidoreductase subunit beta|nr:2-oxoglutarate synthase [Gemmatimonadota bacterium]MBT5146017.1 2-oxoglutarate synthase [Gemmatimonadota bacterium]MBT5591904.1 2-oxoglutarate synthase [Gemmatimonadota bacterium]MBT5961579.1 2-oxoglutarate synthase [Gemmatimonadota bacterium]MBT6626785.1 2-oxoglutarate synthase [Gemmatimonadota bacterium]
MTTTQEARHPMAKYLRPGAEVTTFCPGCGDGMIAHSVLRALDDDGADLDDFAFVCGIGCAGWIPSPYINVDTLHTTHGRPLAFATGVKLAQPDTKVVVISGDGDLTAIGGNHLIHAARRDMDLTVICVNNRIYGMTGGQVAPTTPEGVKTATTPYGAEGRPFDLCRLVEAAGATYVARWTTAQPRFITRSVKRALAHKGFAFIEVMSQCPVHFGKLSGEGSGAHMHDIMRDNSVPLRRAAGLDPADLDGKWVVGELTHVAAVPSAAGG